MKINQAIKPFIDYISKNRNYSENTSEAYFNDILDFANFIKNQGIE